MALTDQFGRIHSYLRISLTDACNMRCTYCMPLKSYHSTADDKMMKADEILKIASLFVEQGITKIRLTGGEPFLRKDFNEIIAQLAQLPVTLAITTNGLLLHKYKDILLKHKVKQLNISLDSLQPKEFERITNNGKLDKIMNNISDLLDHDFKIKINMVMLKDVNESAIIDFIKWTKDAPIDVRFIEFMPFNKNDWDKSKVLGYTQVLESLAHQFKFEKIEDEPNSTSRNFRVNGHIGSFGFITTVTHPFCESCNRLRITADGKLRNCLFSSTEIDLLSALRNDIQLLPLIQENVFNKAAALGGMHNIHSNSDRSMIQIGG